MCRRCTRVLGCLAHLTSSLARRISSQTSDAPLRNAIPCCATAQSEPAVKFQHDKHPTRQHARETAQHGCQPPILEQLRKLPRVGHEPCSALARARPGNDHGACSPNCRGTVQARRLLDDQRAHSEQGTIGSLSEHTCVREHTSATGGRACSGPLWAHQCIAEGNRDQVAHAGVFEAGVGTGNVFVLSH